MAALIPPEAQAGLAIANILQPDMLAGACLKDDAMIRNSLIAAGLFGLALSASQPAFANTRTVGYADLDLTSEAGNAKLDARLKFAAKEVCGLNRTGTTLVERSLSLKCFAETYANARRAKQGLEQTALAAR